MITIEKDYRNYNGGYKVTIKERGLGTIKAHANTAAEAAIAIVHYYGEHGPDPIELHAECPLCRDIAREHQQLQAAEERAAKRAKKGETRA
jgi:hypothetical protein